MKSRIILENKRKKTPSILNLQPKAQDALQVLDNLIASELTLTIHPVDKADGHLGNSTLHRLRAYHHLHLERIPLALRARNDLLEHTLLVKPKATRQVADARTQHRIGKEVRAPAHKLALQVPTVDAAVASVPRARDDVVVGLLLTRYHLRDELGVVTEVGVHDDDEVARDKLEAVDVGRAEAELARPRLEDDVGLVSLDELVRDYLRAVGRSIVDDDELPVEIAVSVENEKLARCRARGYKA